MSATFTVTIETIERPEYGHTLIAPLAADIARDHHLLAVQSGLVEQEADGAQKTTRASFCDNLRARIALNEKRREAFLKQPGIVLQAFTLKIPTYAEYIEAEEAATRTDAHTFTPNISAGKMQSLLLMQCVQDKDGKALTDAQKQAIPANVGRLLGDRILYAAFPSEEELDFFG